LPRQALSDGIFLADGIWPAPCVAIYDGRAPRSLGKRNRQVSLTGAGNRAKCHFARRSSISPSKTFEPVRIGNPTLATSRSRQPRRLALIGAARSIVIPPADGSSRFRRTIL